MAIETPAWEWIVEHGAFWDVFYEHCNYFTGATLRRLCEHAGFEQTVPQLAGVVAVEAHEDEVGARRERLDAGRAEIGELGGDTAAFLDQRADPSLHVVDVANGERARQLLGGIEVVGQGDLVELVDDPLRGDGVAEPGRRHAPRLREGPDDDQAAVVGDAIEGRPGRELGVRLVDEEDPALRLVTDLVDLRRGLPDEAGDEPRPVGLDQVALRDDLQHLVEAGEQASDRRLPRAGVADEHEVEAAVDDGELALAQEVLDPH